MPEPSRVSVDDSLVFLELMSRFDEPEFPRAWRVFQHMAESCPDYQSFQINCPPHGDELTDVERVLRIYDIAGALVKHGGLNQELFFEVAPSASDVWRKAEPWVTGMRTESSRAYQDVEWLAAQHDAWLLAQAP
jgi:hypothetical protein